MNIQNVLGKLTVGFFAKSAEFHGIWSMRFNENIVFGAIILLSECLKPQKFISGSLVIYPMGVTFLEHDSNTLYMDSNVGW